MPTYSPSSNPGQPARSTASRTCSPQQPVLASADGQRGLGAGCEAMNPLAGMAANDIAVISDFVAWAFHSGQFDATSSPCESRARMDDAAPIAMAEGLGTAHFDGLDAAFEAPPENLVLMSDLFEQALGSGLFDEAAETSGGVPATGMPATGMPCAAVGSLCPASSGAHPARSPARDNPLLRALLRESLPPAQASRASRHGASTSTERAHAPYSLRRPTAMPAVRSYTTRGVPALVSAPALAGSGVAELGHLASAYRAARHIRLLVAVVNREIRIAPGSVVGVGFNPCFGARFDPRALLVAVFNILAAAVKRLGYRFTFAHFAKMVGVCHNSMYNWIKRFDAAGMSGASALARTLVGDLEGAVQEFEQLFQRASSEILEAGMPGLEGTPLENRLWRAPPGSGAADGGRYENWGEP